MNPDLVFAEPPGEVAAVNLRTLLEQHLELTGSPRARVMLENWETTLADFRRVHPRRNVALLEEEHEGSAQEAEGAAPVAG
jgi:glutamate synthase domain-containing protein 3